MRKRRRPRLTRDERTAYHEAGHAVAAFFEQLRVRTATIKPDKVKGSLGHVSHYPKPSFHPDFETDARTERRVLAGVLTYLAGPAAERRATGRATGSHDDYRNAMDMASRLCGSNESVGALLRWMWVQARDLVTVHWSFIEAVARALLARRRLSGQEVREIILNSGKLPTLLPSVVRNATVGPRKSKSGRRDSNP